MILKNEEKCEQNCRFYDGSVTNWQLNEKKSMKKFFRSKHINI
jgi:hypothetical protein